MPRIAIVYKYVPSYRQRFFELLRERLAAEGVELVLVAGQPDASSAAKADEVLVDWAHRIKNRHWRLWGQELIWQPCLDAVQDCDLVIVEQASRLLVNYALVVRQALGLQRVAFWGHGRNFQANSRSKAGEFLKRLLSARVHWWFAYNDISAKAVTSLGYPESRITVLYNSIDTKGLSAAHSRISHDEIGELRRRLGISSTNVGIFAGSMYREKKLDFLIESCRLIRRMVPDFEMIFIGAGPDQRLVTQAVADNSWMHYEGACHGDERAKYWAMSKLLLMPGLVGLVVVDSFAMGVPLVTTSHDRHSPEIEYLMDGQNGIMLDGGSPQRYAEGVAALLRDENRRLNLAAGCRSSAGKYTIELMVDNFARGVANALEAERYL